MKTGQKCSIVIFVLALAVLEPFTAFVAPAAKADVKKIMKDVKKTLDSLETFSCSFKRVLVRKKPDRTTKITGSIMMKKPYKIRVNYKNLSFITDGETTWYYLAKNNQVQISTYEYNEATYPSPHSIFKRYSADRKAVWISSENVNGALCDIVKLESKNTEEPQVTVWIDRTLHFPVKTLEEFPSGEVTSHMLDDIKINKKINDTLFTFVPDNKITVIDLRE